MKRVTAAVDRLLVVVAGLALILGGAFALAWYFEVPFARTMLARFDRDALADFPNQSWWQGVLAATAVVGTVVAIALLIGNLSPRRTGTLQIASDEFLAVRVDLSALARGVASELTTFPEVLSARGRAIDDRGTATLAVTVRTTPHIDIDTFTRIVERRAEFVAQTVEGHPVALRVQVHVDGQGRGSTGSASVASAAVTANTG
ncbi:alkaline shock response membrane anchor protein AmaP [Rhodococcoides yunnanense]|uniref:alkaline shock response membrane anchor protein AmaP n=1 Tax=Rhodococcoides yunnanense TaxID=278209 RepID=UPI001FE46B8F|nr:alkaline shock response membrane anchor protein AmaP [Rhodococcus yunnanensis]